MKKISIKNRPDWWLRIVHHYEDNVLGRRWAEWPNIKVTQTQMKKHYNFYVDTELKWVEFENSNDYLMFILKWS